MTFILVIDEGLWLGEKIGHSLLNPNQLRYSGICVWDNPFDPHNPLSIEHEDLSIPLKVAGTTIFVDTHTPLQSELTDCPHIELSCDSEWNPLTVTLATIRSKEAEGLDMAVDELEPGLTQISSVYSFPEMAESLRNIMAVQPDLPSHKTFVSSQRHPAITAEQLSERWNIGLSQARQTIKVTTQRGVRSAILPLSRRYRTDPCTIRRNSGDSNSILTH